MNINQLLPPEEAGLPYESYEEFTTQLFACVDLKISSYIEGLMTIFAGENGGFKNVLYPDLQIAFDLCQKRLADSTVSKKTTSSQDDLSEISSELSSELSSEISLEDLFSDFNLESAEEIMESPISLEENMDYISIRGRATDLETVPLPLFSLCEKMELAPFTVFALTCAILSSTQTSYASVFQVINQNGNLSVPTIESAARIYYGSDFVITKAYSEMSLALEQLRPILAMHIDQSMPFSTALSPDKRFVDFLFSAHGERPDENYQRFMGRLDLDVTKHPFIANKTILEAVNISYDQGGRIFSLFGDDGSGRKFTLSHFCKEHGLGCVTLNCAKLFIYDFSYVEQVLWSLTRECILTGAVCCLDFLTYREDEKEKFFGYMDLAFGKLMKFDVCIFAVSKEKMPMSDITTADFAQLELPTPSNGERQTVWNHYAKDYSLGNDVDLEELATKFLFTPGKIKNALHQGKNLSLMAKEILISRKSIFASCNMQMSTELLQKATRIPANFGWDDIVMSPDQRLALENACNQLTFRKKVYEDWNYTKKYQYGRGLSVLLFGAPGTGKSMCAQVIAHEMNLELYRVDLSKVVDKYVGETEKSISMIFREAKKCNVVLFFDECDTLFAKRSDDGGSGQASNNNKTALLLQEVEAYDGVSVLATNYKHNIDPAFFRRMKFIVEFQFPDVPTRKILWDATIPKDTPLAEDVDVDFLAEKFEFVGGNIKNCILNGAFLAAADPTAEGEVHMRHYLQAIKYEFVKTGKVFTRSDFEPFADQVL